MICLESDGTGEAVPLLFSNSLGEGGEVSSGPVSLLPHSIVSSSMSLGVLEGRLPEDMGTPFLDTTGGGLATSSASVPGSVCKVVLVSSIAAGLGVA